MITCAAGENLGFVFKPAKTATVDNAVAVALKAAARGMFSLLIVASARSGTEGCIGGKYSFFLFFEIGTVHNVAILIKKDARL
jgi:hypothetical protein